MSLWFEAKGISPSRTITAIVGTGSCSTPSTSCVLRAHRSLTNATGEFDHDLIHGEGLWSWPDGSSYAGQAKHGVREGRGLYVTAMKVSIEPRHRRYSSTNTFLEKSNSPFHSSTTTTPYSQRLCRLRQLQDAFFGDFASNKPHGEVLAHYCDGSKHQGTFQEGTRHGRGTTEEENGNRVIGTWAFDKRDGVFEVGASWPGYERESGLGLIKDGAVRVGSRPDWVSLQLALLRMSFASPL